MNASNLVIFYIHNSSLFQYTVDLYLTQTIAYILEHVSMSSKISLKTSNFVILNDIIPSLARFTQRTQYGRARKIALGFVISL